MDIEQNKRIILNILKDTLKKREGANNFIYYLKNSTDFFTAPASTIFHGNFEGGLAQHSLNVYNLLKEKVERYKMKTADSTISICGLLHDICKTNFYIKTKKWDKKFKEQTGEWRQIDIYETNETFPAGHGEKSVFILQRFLKLTDEEIITIRWHMGGMFDASIHFQYPNGIAFKKALEMYPLLTLMISADMEASAMLDKTIK